MKKTLRTPLEILQEARKVEVGLTEQVRRNRKRATYADRARRLDRKESIIGHLTRMKKMETLVTVLKRVGAFLQEEGEVDL